MTSGPVETPAPGVYVVVQTNHPVDVVDRVCTALDAGARGVFLIDHDLDDERLFDACAEVRRDCPAAFLGVNLFGRCPVEALLAVTHAGLDLDALWTDNAHIDLDGDLRAAVDFLNLREHLRWQGVHFGGVAFTHQPEVPTEQLSRLGALAAAVVDVPTTSGPDTGQWISVERLARLRSGLDRRPLAVASGVSLANIDELGPLLTHVLVSSSVTDASGEIDECMLSELVRRVEELAAMPAEVA
jgi:hypothetical protein